MNGFQLCLIYVYHILDFALSAHYWRWALLIEKLNVFPHRFCFAHRLLMMAMANEEASVVSRSEFIPTTE